MKNQFNDKLIQETITVFREEDGLELTPEEACVYLQSLGGLFLAFAKGGGNRASNTPVPPPLT